MLFKTLEKLVLFAIAISIPLNLDFSVIISPYARNAANIFHGYRTIVALTELRVSLILIVVVVGYILWLVDRQGASRRPFRFFAGTSRPALGLIFISIISVFQAQDIQLSLFRIVQLVELFLVYLYLANHIRTKQEMQYFVTVLMWGMLAESILMVVQRLTGWGFSIPGIDASIYTKLSRAEGTLGSPGTAGGILAAYLAIVSAMVWLFPKRSQKVFALVCFVVGCIALITTAGRAPWGSFVVAILGFILVAWRQAWIQRRTLILLFTMILVIGYIFSPMIYNRLTQDDRGSAESRLRMFRLAWNVIQASPSHLFLGVGANNYALVAPGYNTSDVGFLGYVIDSSVHNAYLLAWAETGLFGLFFFIVFLAVPLLKSWKHIRSGNRFISIIALGLGCALVAMCIQMLVDPFVARPLTIFVWLLVSLITSLDNMRSIRISSPDTRQV